MQQRRTPAQIAQDDLDKANQAVAAAQRRHDTLSTQQQDAAKRLARAIKRRDYLALNPDLINTEDFQPVEDSR